nr:MAG TPA: hypothetical protein [Bacteriophage sp.]DAO35872.1 MAG TPA: hypothetical protein [Caudoviricetes sp.]
MTINNAISAITKDVLILIWQFIMSFLLLLVSSALYTTETLKGFIAQAIPARRPTIFLIIYYLAPLRLPFG